MTLATFGAHMADRGIDMPPSATQRIRGEIGEPLQGRMGMSFSMAKTVANNTNADRELRGRQWPNYTEQLRVRTYDKTERTVVSPHLRWRIWLSSRDGQPLGGINIGCNSMP